MRHGKVMTVMSIAAIMGATSSGLPYLHSGVSVNRINYIKSSGKKAKQKVNGGKFKRSKRKGW